MSIDGAIPVDRNVINKEAEIILNYEELTIEIQSTLNVKSKLIPKKQFFCLMRKTTYWSMSKHFRITLYIKNSWERCAEDFIFIKVGGATIRNSMLHDYRACPLFPLRYDRFQHAQQILKYALSKRPHDTNNRTVE